MGTQQTYVLNSFCTVSLPCLMHEVALGSRYLVAVFCRAGCV